jgi:hypothetical protein
VGEEADMGVLIEVGEGGTGDEAIDYGSSRCSSLVFRIGVPGRMTGVKIAYYQTVVRHEDDV